MDILRCCCCCSCFYSEQNNQQQNPYNNNFKDSNSSGSKKKPFYSYGLPNLGLTCHLNTALQLLFSMETLGKKIIHNGARTDKQRIWPWNFHLGRLFQAMVEDRSDKTQLLEKLISHIERNNPQIKIKQQNDLIRILSLLLYELQQQDKTISDYYTLQLQKKCDCNLDMEYFETFLSPGQKCGRCGKQIQIKSSSDFPPYVLCLGNKSHHIFLRGLKIINHKQRSCTYSILGFGNYIGNQMTGHYTFCLRRQNQWVEISDNICSRLQNVQKKINSAMVLLLVKEQSLESYQKKPNI